MSDETPAAVLVPLILSKDTEKGLFPIPTWKGPLSIGLETEVLLTVRTDTVEHHKGQISFPGGVHEENDDSLEVTALRETWEEIGLPEKHVELVGDLPDLSTVSSNYRVKPFVGIIKDLPELKPNPGEIAEILKVPLFHFVDKKNHVEEVYEHNGVRFKLKSYYYQERYRIWGATARIIQVLLGTSKGEPRRE